MRPAKTAAPVRSARVPSRRARPGPPRRAPPGRQRRARRRRRPGAPGDAVLASTTRTAATARTAPPATSAPRHAAVRPGARHRPFDRHRAFTRRVDGDDQRPGGHRRAPGGGPTQKEAPRADGVSEREAQHALRHRFGRTATRSPVDRDRLQTEALGVHPPVELQPHLLGGLGEDGAGDRSSPRAVAPHPPRRRGRRLRRTLRAPPRGALHPGGRASPATDGRARSGPIGGEPLEDGSHVRGAYRRGTPR